MDELFKRINTDDLYQPFFAKLQLLVANCRARGVDYWCLSGHRPVEEQDTLFQQGRTAPGPIVTKARGGQSTHNYHIAADFCKDKDVARAGLQPAWDRPSYLVLAEEAEKLDLEAGYYWKFEDNPHVQLKLSKHGVALFSADPERRTLLTLYKTGGDAAVTAYLDSFVW